MKNSKEILFCSAILLKELGQLTTVFPKITWKTILSPSVGPIHCSTDYASELTIFFFHLFLLVEG